MQVLIAYDGLPDAERALRLTLVLGWPEGSTLTVASVIEPYEMRIGLAPEVDEAIREAAHERVRAAADRLASGDRRTEPVVLHGRVASALVDEATRLEVDLLVTGSHGHGPLGTFLLGSVSAELVEQAPCPVLVARSQTVRSVLLAVDGSEAASAAESLLSSWPIFEDVSISVVSVAVVMEPVQFGVASPRYHRAAAEHAALVAEIEEYHAELAEQAAARLRAAGRSAEGSMRRGRAADEILGLSSEIGADLIVMGTRGRTGLKRILLGSNARTVLYRAEASVLVARAHPAA
jgi:universal stress protein E